MYIMCVVATAIAVVPLLVSLLLPNWYLGDQQNAVDETDLTGERVGEGGKGTVKEVEEEGKGASG